MGDYHFLTCGSRSTNIWKKTPKWWFMSFQMTLSCRNSPAILILAHSQFLEKLPIFCWHYGYFHHTRLFSQFMDCKKNVRKPCPPVERDYSQLTRAFDGLNMFKTCLKHLKTHYSHHLKLQSRPGWSPPNVAAGPIRAARGLVVGGTCGNPW